MISNTTTGVSVMEATQGTILQQGVVRPDPEVSEKPTRRRFTAEYKRRILLRTCSRVTVTRAGVLRKRRKICLGWAVSNPTSCLAR